MLNNWTLNNIYGWIGEWSIHTIKPNNVCTKMFQSTKTKRASIFPSHFPFEKRFPAVLWFQFSNKLVGWSFGCGLFHSTFLLWPQFEKIYLRVLCFVWFQTKWKRNSDLKFPKTNPNWIVQNEHLVNRNGENEYFWRNGMSFVMRIIMKAAH